MSIHRRLILPTLAALIAGGSSLTAQVTTGSLSGIVTDASGKPIEKVRVTLESPALFTSKTYITNADGGYRALLLPVGNYTIRVTANGMLSKTATGVRVGIGNNLTLSFSLKPMTSTSSAVVEVVGGMAEESKSDDKIAVNFSAEKLLQLPTGGGPSFQGALGAAPGVTGAYDPSNTKIRGGDLNQVMYRIDGINVKDDAGDGAGGLGPLYQPLPDSIEDVQVVLTALNARFGSVSGGSVNVVTKSGSNEFVGTIRNTFNRQSWQSNYTQANDSYNASHRNENFDQSTDLTLSGPIWKDRVWFYVGTRLQPSKGKDVQLNYSNTGIVMNNGVATGATVPWSTVKNELIPETTYGTYPAVDALIAAGPGGTYKTNLMNAGDWQHATIDYKKYEGKLTGAITESQILSATYLFEESQNGGSYAERGTGTLASVVNPNQLGNNTIQTKGWTLNWNASLASNWTIEARYSNALRTQNDVPRPAGSDAYGSYSSGPSMWLQYQSPNPNLILRDQGNGAGKGDVYFYGYVADPYRQSTYNTLQKRGNDSFTVNVTTFQEFFGKHQIDFGFEKNQTVYDFGRGRAGHAAIWNGGSYMDANGHELFPVIQKVPYADGTYPVIRDIGAHSDIPGATVATPGTGWNGDTWQLRGNQYTMWWASMTGPGATLERAWTYSKDEKNHTDSEYVNDSWTINSYWNALIGLRFNKLGMQSGGLDIETMSVVEPRAQIKFNPDGQNKRIISLSYAKLSQAYSDQIANYFRASEWSVNTMTPWTGAALGYTQPGIDSPGAANDIVSGVHNGYDYGTAGTNMHGVRFVDYATIANEANYSVKGSGDITDPNQTSQPHGLKAPYALEWNLGFQRNFANGWFKLNLVQRTFKDQIQGHWWAGILDYGTNNWVAIHNPNPGDPNYKQLAWKVTYPNSEKDQVYRNVEFSFDQQLSTRWNVTGNFTYERTTGVNQEQYYTNKTLRDALIPQDKQGDIYPDAILSDNKFGYIAFTYVQPVGKGNISFSTKFNYNNNGGYTQPQSQLSYQDLPGFAAYSNTVPNTLPNSATGGLIRWHSQYGSTNGIKASNLFYTVYTGSAGQYRNSWDTYSADAKLNADVPIVGKLHLIGYIEVHNIFNNMLLTSMYTAFSDGNNQGLNGGGSSGDARVAGRMYERFAATGAYGQGTNAKIAGGGYQDYNWGNGGRSFTNVSVGLKF